MHNQAREHKDETNHTHTVGQIYCRICVYFLLLLEPPGERGHADRGETLILLTCLFGADHNEVKWISNRSQMRSLNLHLKAHGSNHIQNLLGLNSMYSLSNGHHHGQCRSSPRSCHAFRLQNHLHTRCVRNILLNAFKSPSLLISPSSTLKVSVTLSHDTTSTYSVT